MTRLGLGLLLLVVFSGSSNASPHPDDRYFDSRAQVGVAKVVRHKTTRHHVRQRAARRGAIAHRPIRYRRVTWSAHTDVQGAVVGGRPAGCPRAFCGCGASLRVWGRIVPFFNLAKNWLTLPRAHAAPGMVAVRHHHVFVLERHLNGNAWIAHDSNSGGHKTRVHARSISGYVIVDPRRSG